MSVCKAHSPLSQPVDVRGLYLLRTIASQITVSEVVGHNEDDVGVFAFRIFILFALTHRFLQTDSAINPGSSGGPLLNLRGEVVGITTALASEAQSIGFAVPINTVKQVMPLLIVNRTERGWFGVTARPLAPGEAKQRGYPKPRGILVESVEPGSPAEASGIEAGDLIVRVGDREIDSFVLLSRQLLRLLPGDEIQVTLLRGDDLVEITSTLAENPRS